MKQPVTVQHEHLVDIQDDGYMVGFLRHFVHSGKDGRVLRVFDTDYRGEPYTVTGMQQRPGPYDNYTGIVCVIDPEDPANPIRMRQFIAKNGIVTYTSIQGLYQLELPVGAIITECEA